MTIAAAEHSAALALDVIMMILPLCSVIETLTTGADVSRFVKHRLLQLSAVLLEELDGDSPFKSTRTIS